MKRNIPLFEACLVFLTILNHADSDQFEYDLFDMLMYDYNPLERPVENSSLPVVVKLGVDLLQVVDLVSSSYPFNQFMMICFCL